MSELEDKFQLRCTPEQRAMWQSAAAQRGVGLSEWIRKVLDATAERTLSGDGRPVERAS